MITTITIFYVLISHFISDWVFQSRKVAHKDRLSRFGFDLIEIICKKHGTEIEILTNDKCSPEEEMVRDLMTIIHCFSSRLYGLRNYRKELKEKLK